MSFFMRFYTRLQSTEFIVDFVLVLVLDKILILEDEHEFDDEYEMYRLQSAESAHI